MVSAEVLKRYGLFEGLSEAQLKDLAAIAEEKPFKLGTIVFREGSEARDIYLLLEGKVLLEVEIRVRERQHVRLAAIDVVTAGESFGWSAIIEPHVYTLTATAIDPVRVVSIKGESLLKAMERDCAMGYIVAKKLCGVIASRLLHTRLTLISERGLAVLAQEFSY